jgi:hypothetical protein
MRLREFIVSCGAVAVWPTALRAQPAGRKRTVGVLMGVKRPIQRGRRA